MDQVKIGRFIAEQRKAQGLTQAQLAERLGITDRAVSKWETGRSLPDASVMLPLCGLLHITVNDLLNGEVISMERYNETTERNLLEMVKQKEAADKRLLKLEIVIMLVSLALVAVLMTFGILLCDNGRTRIGIPLIAVGFVQFLACGLLATRIEQTAGYYECAKCGHRYVPSYWAVNFAMHVNRTRYMKCPACHKRSWQKKVLSKE